MKLQFQSLDFIFMDKLSIVPFLYNETLKPPIRCICNLAVHRDISVLNMVDVNVPTNTK